MEPHAPTRRARLRGAVAASSAAALLAGAGLGAAATIAVGGGSAEPAPAVTGTPVAATAETTMADVYAAAAAGVVEITVGGGAAGSGPFGFGDRAVTSGGSGFVYDVRGHVVTNAHVVEGATEITVTTADGTEHPATLVGTDPTTDLAVLRIDADGLEHLALGDSEGLRVGQLVLAIGSPFGLESTLTAGIVSALGREIVAPNDAVIADAIQTDAAINPGNSGGPLLDLTGSVVGVNAQIQSNWGGNEGVGFAIPADTVAAVVEELIGSGSASRTACSASRSRRPTGAARRSPR